MNLILNVVLYLAAAATLAMGFGLLYGYRDTRRRGLLLLALVYVAAGALAMVAVTWWPIIVGFILAVVIRKLRVDLHGPGTSAASGSEPHVEAPAEAPSSGHGPTTTG